MREAPHELLGLQHLQLQYVHAEAESSDLRRPVILNERDQRAGQQGAQGLRLRVFDELAGDIEGELREIPHSLKTSLIQPHSHSLTKLPQRGAT